MKNASSTANQLINQPALSRPLKTSPSTSPNTPFASVNKTVDQSFPGSVAEKVGETRDEYQGKKAEEGFLRPLEVTSPLDVSLDISSSCKESEFQDLSDLEDGRKGVEGDGRNPEPRMSESILLKEPLRAKTEILPKKPPEEIEILLPALQIVRDNPVPTLETKERMILPALIPEVQLRYCTVCHIDQPLRTKHCNTCGRCVARYDHHCPWLSVCIGERNHCSFLVYLYAQCAELAVGIAVASVDLEEDMIVDDVRTWLRLALIIVAGGLLILLSSLTFFQTALACSNLTTWEYTSWSKITYLKDTQARSRSPFSQGMCANIALLTKGGFAPVPMKWQLSPSQNVPSPHVS